MGVHSFPNKRPVLGSQDKERTAMKPPFEILRVWKGVVAEFLASVALRERGDQESNRRDRGYGCLSHGKRPNSISGRPLHRLAGIESLESRNAVSTLIWVGGDFGTWDMTSANWFNPDTGNTQTWDTSAQAVIESGTVQLDGSVTAINGLELWNSATLDLNGLNDVAIGWLQSSGGYITSWAGNSMLTVAGGSIDDISSSVSLAISGDVILNAQNSSPQTVYLESGTLLLSNSNALAEGATLFASGGTLDLYGNGTDSTISWSGFGGLTTDYVNPVSFNGAVGIYDGNLTVNTPIINTPGDSDITINGPVGGAGGLTKTGPGTLTVNGDCTYDGATTVSAGTLAMTGGIELGNAPITVAGGATFAPHARVIDTGELPSSAGGTGAGNSGATLTLDSGSTLSITDNSGGSFSLYQQNSFSGTSLSINNATLDLGIGSAGADHLTTTGAASVSGTNTVNITAIGSSLSPGHSYNLITAASGLSGNFVFANGANVEALTVGTQSYALMLSNTDMAEKVTVIANADYWVGSAGSQNWDTGTANWSTTSGGSIHTMFHNGDAAVFTNASAYPNVAVAANVSPSIVIFQNDSRTRTR
jgi:fibronectin-binding autotransporter adhesin